jgi:hypothetical protein
VVAIDGSLGRPFPRLGEERGRADGLKDVNDGHGHSAELFRTADERLYERKASRVTLLRAVPAAS